MNISCLISDSSEAIRLLTLDVYKMTVYSDFVLINNHGIEISSSKRSLTVKLDVMQICSSLFTRIEFSHGSFSSMHVYNKQRTLVYRGKFCYRQILYSNDYMNNYRWLNDCHYMW